MKKYKGVYVREGFKVDKSMVKDCLTHYKHFTFDEKSVVMDMGANIGGFAHMLKDTPIKEYIAFEPDPSNHTVLVANADDLKCQTILFCAAVSTSYDYFLTFHQNESGNAKCSGTVRPKRKRSVMYQVANYNISNVIDHYHPTHLKIDIEGAELDWLEMNKGILPDVQEIALEIHTETGVKKFENEWYHNVIKQFDIIEVIPNMGFIKPDSPVTYLPNLQIELKGAVFGIDLFLRKKK